MEHKNTMLRSLARIDNNVATLDIKTTTVTSLTIRLNCQYDQTVM